ncbi:MAG: dynamin family protein [Paludibacteraceae bacterium]|nr:dynamin family protein [Paludibacteraceae bacterium]
MEMLSCILISATALISGFLVFVLMKFVFGKTCKIEDDKNAQKKDEAISALEIKLQEAQKSKISLSVELSSCKEQLSDLQQQLAKALEGNLDTKTIAKMADALTLREQIAKLEKKIKELEDESENYEDEIDDLKKELKRGKSEIEELDEQLQSSKKKNNELEEEVATISAKLDNTQKTLFIKEESLSFVQEVLQAEKASDSKELETAIDRFVDFIKGELSDVLKDISKSPIDESLLQNWSLSARKIWLKNKTTIAFVGEFSAGKTSIVNRILSQDDKNIPLLPVSAKATTAIPTYISGGITTAYQFYSPDNNLKSISETTFKKVNKEVLDQVEGLSSLITYFVMKYKNPNLDKLSILDTPGFNSNDSEDYRRTIEVINECDALFWVFDVNAGTVNRSSLKIIKEHLAKPLYIVINKVDTKSDKEIDSVEMLIKKTIEAEGITVKEYIRFSSNPKYELDSIMNPIRNVVHDTSKEEFINELENRINSLQNEWCKIAKESTSSYDKSRKEYDGVVDKYINVQNQLFQACENAVNIPHFESHLFRKDNYEMSQQEYSQLENILTDDVPTECNKLATLFDESNEIVDKMNDLYNNKFEAEQSLRKLNDIIKKFKKYDDAYRRAALNVLPLKK